MHETKLAQFIGLPGLIIESTRHRKETIEIICRKQRTQFEICPRCATKSTSIYDTREVKSLAER